MGELFEIPPASEPRDRSVVLRFPLAACQFRENGPDEDPTAHLLGVVRMEGRSNAMTLHVEAIAVFDDDETGTQEAVHHAYDADLARYRESAGGGVDAFQTVTINGRDYAIFLHPFFR